MELVFNTDVNIAPVYKFWALRPAWYLGIQFTGSVYGPYDEEFYKIYDHGTAIPLLLNVEPKNFQDYLDKFDDRTLDIYGKFEYLIAEALHIGSLEYWIESEEQVPYRSISRNIGLNPVDLIRWALSIQLRVPEQFRNLLKLVEKRDRATKDLQSEEDPQITGKDLGNKQSIEAKPQEFLTTVETSSENSADQKKNPEMSYEEFVQQIRMWMKDELVIIKFPNQRIKMTYSRDELGFSKCKDGTWNTLETILNLGFVNISTIPADEKKRTFDRKNYDKERNTLRNISRKLVIIFKKVCPEVDIPSNYFLFKAYDGKYRPLFQVKELLHELIRQQQQEQNREALDTYRVSPYDDTALSKYDEYESEK